MTGDESSIPGLPEWLVAYVPPAGEAGKPVGFEIPPWLSALMLEAADAPTALEPGEVEGAGSGIPPWLQTLIPSSDIVGTVALGPNQAGDPQGLPEWLMVVAPIDTQGEPPAAAGPASAEIPPWLATLNTEAWMVGQPIEATPGTVGIGPDHAIVSRTTSK